ARRNRTQPRGREVLVRRNLRGSHRLRRELRALQLRHRRVRAAPASIIVNLIPVFGLASAVFWLGDSLTAARVLGAILIGLSVTIFTAAELAEARSDAKASVTPSKA